MEIPDGSSAGGGQKGGALPDNEVLRRSLPTDYGSLIQILELVATLNPMEGQSFPVPPQLWSVRPGEKTGMRESDGQLTKGNGPMIAINPALMTLACIPCDYDALLPSALTLVCGPGPIYTNNQRISPFWACHPDNRLGRVG